MEKFYFITLALLAFVVIQNLLLNGNTVNTEDNEDITNDILTYFNTKQYLGQTRSNVADFSVILKVYSGEPSCAFLLVDNDFICFVSGENELQRKTLLEIISNTIDNTVFPEEKIFWIKPDTSKNSTFEA